jgi:NADH-quinone oxidoreductase subunit A
MFQLVDVVSSPSQYLPIGIQLLFAIGFVVAMIGASHLLGPRRKTADKLENFESGIEQIGNARQPMAVKYFLVAILFVLFDVEVIFFYPYAINFKSLGWSGFWAVLMFVGFFLAGFTYIIKKGALQWED